MNERCAILSDKFKVYPNYNEIYLENTMSNLDVRLGKGWTDSEGVKVNTWEIKKDLDHTSDLNCLMKYKNDTKKKFNQNKDLDVTKIINSTNRLKFDIQDYDRSIKSVSDLEKSKRYYENTRLEHMNQEMEMERKMNKKLLDDFVKRARQERMNLQDEFDKRLDRVYDQNDRDLTEESRKHKSNVNSLNNKFDSDVTDIKDKFKTIINNRNDTINKLSKNSNTMEDKYISILETSNTINKQKQLNFDSLEDINQANTIKYDNIYNKNLRLERVARNSHNSLVGENIKEKIDNDMYLINRIQSNRENFTNNKEINYFLYLLFSLGAITSLVLLKKKI
tara:strand:- start:10369 stop:11376 length:1008 start_codon:yes stop_codon:yes gene_type:complete